MEYRKKHRDETISPQQKKKDHADNEGVILSDELSFLQNLTTPLRDPLSNLKNSIRITEVKQRSIAF